MFFNAEKVWNMFGSMKDKQGKNIETCGYMIHKNILHQMEKCNKFEQKFEISDNPQELTPIVCGLTGHDGRPYCTYEPLQAIPIDPYYITIDCVSVFFEAIDSIGDEYRVEDGSIFAEFL